MDAPLSALFDDPFVARGLVALVVKATVLAGLGLAAVSLMRRESAARRHLALALVLGGLVALPFLELFVPAWYAGSHGVRVEHVRVKVLHLDGAAPVLAPLAPTAPESPLPPIAPEAPEATSAPEAPETPLAPAAPDEAALAPAALAVRGGNDAAGADGGVPVVAAADRLPLRGVLLGLWLAGSLVAALYFALGRLRVIRWGRTMPEVDDAAAIHTAHLLSGALGIRRRVRLIWTETATPMTWGVLRPVVALPREARTWSPERLRLVLMHELTHVARLDALSQALAHLACTVFWFHPLVWASARRLTQERELACDDAVLTRGARASSYAQHLLDVARGLRRPQAVPVAALAMARRGELEGRLTAILATGRRRDGLRRAHAFGASLLVLVLVLPLAAFKPWEAPLKSKAAQRLKNAITSTPLVERAAALMGISGPAMAEVATDDAHCTGNVRPGGTFTLRTDVGSVEVRSWDRSTVEVTLDQNIGTRFRSTCRISGGNATVEGRLDRGNRWNWGRNQRVRYVVRVPARYHLDVQTSGGSISTSDHEGRVALRTSGGSLSLGSIKGVVQAHTSGGSISLDRAAGNVRLETSGGSVSVGPVTGDLYVHTSGGSVSLDGGATGAIDASTSGGTVEAMLARQPRGDVRLETSGGSVRVGVADGLRFDVDAATSAGRVRSDFHNGRATESLRGEIGGGGPLLRLRTSAGNIQINRAGRMSLNHYRSDTPGPQRRVAYNDAEIEADVAREMRRVERDLANLRVEIGDVDVNLDQTLSAEISESVRLGLAEARRELAQAQPEIQRALREALPQAQRELQRALREVQREQAQALREADRERAQALREAQRDLEQALREIKENRGTSERARQEALREARRNHEEALREAEADREEALREARREQQEALREAEREREEARREAEQDRREALREAEQERRDALREAQRERDEALREAAREQREAERARREADRERARKTPRVRTGMHLTTPPGGRVEAAAVSSEAAVSVVSTGKKAEACSQSPSMPAVPPAPRVMVTAASQAPRILSLSASQL
jgi:beta-lactamase regulating signal transducer with metallopeptidase domain